MTRSNRPSAPEETRANGVLWQRNSIEREGMGEAGLGLNGIPVNAMIGIREDDD
jgi:hypothetical protein